MKLVKVSILKNGNFRQFKLKKIQKSKKVSDSSFRINLIYVFVLQYLLTSAACLVSRVCYGGIGGGFKVKYTA
jgi:hypothetical protein